MGDDEQYPLLLHRLPWLKALKIRNVFLNKRKAKYMRRIITDEDDEFIRKNIDKYSYKEFEEILNQRNNTNIYTIGTISAWIRNHGLKDLYNPSNRVFSDLDIEFIKNNYSTMTYGQIAKTLGYTDKQIRCKAEHMGLTKNRIFNKDYWETIDTPTKAYFLGLIYADGWILMNENPRVYEFGMQLQEQDKYILDFLNNELGGKHIVKFKPAEINYIGEQILHGGNSYVLRVYCKKMVQDLYKLGIETNKTQKDKHPIIEEKYFFDFLRGYIDGDGTYSYFKRKYLYMQLVCAKEKPLIYIRDTLKEYDIETKIYRKNNIVFSLLCTKRDSMKKLINLMYYSNDVICLTRKLDKVVSLIDGSAA